VLCVSGGQHRAVARYSTPYVGIASKAGTPVHRGLQHIMVSAAVHLH
jgi:hypothetical protein